MVWPGGRAYGDRVADFLPPQPSGKQERKPRTGYALAVVAAGALLVFCAILPWAGIEARSDLIGSGITKDMRGVDDSSGVYTLLAGLAAAAFGVTGLLTRRPWTALAILPGAAAATLLVMFVAGPRDAGDRVSVDIGGVLSIEPVLRYGWFTALASALAVIAFAALSLIPRRA